jgi:DNA repair protein SbcC/Rad50
MMFSKFFSQKNKWQHKNSNVRIEAIKDDLDPLKADDVSILSKLAQSDESELVRRSALIKLNKLNAWLTSFKSDTSDSIKKQAANSIVELVASEKGQISVNQKLKLVESQLTVSMAEAVLAKTENSELAIAAIKKINKPHKWPAIIAQTKNVEVQTYLLSQIDDVSVLEKLLKKSLSKEVIAKINDKVTQIISEKEKPTKLLKDINLVLAKLLALKDLHDYQDVLEKRTSLNDEWNWLTQEFDCLNDNVKEEIIEKRHQIDTQLDKSFLNIKEAYEQERIVRSLEQEKLTAIKGFDTKLTQYNKRLADAVFENETLDNHALANEIEEQTIYINSSVLSNKDKQDYIERFNQVLNKLEQLPKLAESVTEATHLISKMSQKLPPTNLEQLDERNQYFNEWLQEWKVIESSVSIVMPQSILDAKAQIVSQWRNALAPLFKEQKQLFFLAQKKADEITRLIDSGKFNASFGVFKRFKKLFEQLNGSQQQRLQRSFDMLSEKISELSDWEHYIATPRKQELLEQIKQLTNTPLDNPKEQAKQVKACRKTWNSLGHADEEIDQALNDSFNVHCELAFAPCRLYYAEQEKIREHHLAIRQKIVGQAKQLSSESTELDIKELDTRLNSLTQQWREAGEVERADYQKLNLEFTASIKPIKDLVKKEHEHNAQLKQALIEQVIAQHKADDLFSSVETVKKLQSRWKEVGYAGARLENKLWSEFRKANDVIFAKREQEQNKSKIEAESKFSALEQEVVMFDSQLSNLSSITDMKAFKSTLEVFISERRKEKPAFKEIINRASGLLEQTSNKLEQMRKEQETKQWSALFNLLTLLSSNDASIESLENNEQFIMLPSAIQKRLIDALSKHVGHDRKARTIELEILAGIDSPEDEQDLRRQIQVKVMQEKMTSGQATNLEKLFFGWIAAEPINKDTLVYLERIKPIYTA